MRKDYSELGYGRELQARATDAEACALIQFWKNNPSANPNKVEIDHYRKGNAVTIVVREIK